MINRRAFLSALGFGTVAAAAAANGLIDVERLLWVPGEKTIILPAVKPVMLPDVTVYCFNYKTGATTTYLREAVDLGDGLYRVDLRPMDGSASYALNASWVEP